MRYTNAALPSRPWFCEHRNTITTPKAVQSRVHSGRGALKNFLTVRGLTSRQVEPLLCRIAQVEPAAFAGTAKMRRQYLMWGRSP
jgi:hypothetical protein